MSDDAEAHVISAKMAEEALRAAGPGYQHGYHAGLTAAARTAKTILDERDALRVRVEKAEAEVERLKAGLDGWRTKFLDYGECTTVCKIKCDENGDITTPCDCGFMDLLKAAFEEQEKP